MKKACKGCETIRAQRPHEKPPIQCKECEPKKPAADPRSILNIEDLKKKPTPDDCF